MSGSLVNLVAKGIQDTHLTGSPEISFFRSTYKRHTNFVQSIVELRPVGNLASNSMVTLPITRKGDMLSYIYCDTGSSPVGTTFGLSDKIIGDSPAGANPSPALFRLFIGGQEIEQFDAFFATRLYNKYLLNSNSKAQAAQSDDADGGMVRNIDNGTFFPLPFNCTQEVGMSLPLLALQFHDVEIRVQFNQGTPSSDLKFYACYVHLDTEERKMMASMKREMLITQVQRITPDSTFNYDLSLLNHPVKALMWADTSYSLDVGGNIDGVGVNAWSSARVQVNGNDLSEPLPKSFYNTVQSYFHVDVSSDLHLGHVGGNYFMHSFALKANSRAPCGTCNFSRMDNAFLRLDGVDQSLGYLYAVNYNILKIESGLGGLAYSS